MIERYSVVIPTHNRIDILPETLEALSAQVGAPDFEIVVVNDGSTDGTAGFLDAYRGQRETRIVHQANAGPAVARNVGTRLATGQYVAFLGDDTVPEQGWLAAHVRRRQQFEPRSTAVIGYTRWHSRMTLNPLLVFLNEEGLQFGYSLIEDPDRVPFNFFYSSNLSLARELLLAEPFDESFPFPAFEDVEVGYRLTTRRELRLVYARDAVVQHDHPTTYARFAKRQEKAGYSSIVLHRLHPELGAMAGLKNGELPDLPIAWIQAVREFLIQALENKPVRLKRMWLAALHYHYVKGMQAGTRGLLAPDS